MSKKPFQVNIPDPPLNRGEGWMMFWHLCLLVFTIGIYADFCLLLTFIDNPLAEYVADLGQ
jgi:hypothetical protein